MTKGEMGAQRETPLRAELRESLDSKIWSEVVHGARVVLIFQTIVREDRLHSNVSNFSSYESLNIEC